MHVSPKFKPFGGRGLSQAWCSSKSCCWSSRANEPGTCFRANESWVVSMYERRTTRMTMVRQVQGMIQAFRIEYGAVPSQVGFLFKNEHQSVSPITPLYDWNRLSSNPCDLMGYPSQMSRPSLIFWSALHTSRISLWTVHTPCIWVDIVWCHRVFGECLQYHISYAKSASWLNCEKL